MASLDKYREIKILIIHRVGKPVSKLRQRAADKRNILFINHSIRLAIRTTYIFITYIAQPGMGLINRISKLGQTVIQVVLCPVESIGFKTEERTDCKTRNGTGDQIVVIINTSIQCGKISGYFFQFIFKLGENNICFPG